MGKVRCMYVYVQSVNARAIGVSTILILPGEPCWPCMSRILIGPTQYTVHFNWGLQTVAYLLGLSSRKLKEKWSRKECI